MNWELSTVTHWVMQIVPITSSVAVCWACAGVARFRWALRNASWITWATVCSLYKARKRWILQTSSNRLPLGGTMQRKEMHEKKTTHIPDDFEPVIHVEELAAVVIGDGGRKAGPQKESTKYPQLPHFQHHPRSYKPAFVTHLTLPSKILMTALGS